MKLVQVVQPTQAPPERGRLGHRVNVTPHEDEMMLYDRMLLRKKTKLSESSYVSYT